MFKNQLQELAQRSCFNLPSYSSVREGPDHVPRFKSTVTFNGEAFESPGFFNNLRQAEHAAAEVALDTLSKRGSTQSLASRILDETGVCKNLLQDTTQRAGVKFPIYAIISRSGPGHSPSFVCTVQVAGKSFEGEPAKTKKQAEKNAATAAWNSLKNSVQGVASTFSDSSNFSGTEEQIQAAIVQILKNTGLKNSTESMGELRMQGAPLFTRPVSTSRIKIVPFKDQPCQPSVKMLDSLSSTPVTTIADSEDMLPPKSQIKITPLEEQHDAETPSASKLFVMMSTNLKAERLLHSKQDNDGSSHLSCHEGVADSSLSKCDTELCGLPTIKQQKAAYFPTIVTNSDPPSQVTYIPVSHVQIHDRHLDFSGVSSVMIAKGNDFGSPDSVLPAGYHGYTPVLWSGQCQQMVSTSAESKPVGSLAPSVNVLHVLPLSSQHISGDKSEENISTVADALQGLHNLKL